jgi:hypothetical protein
MADILAFGNTVWMPHSDPSSYSFSCTSFQWNHGCQIHHRWLPKGVSEPRKPDAIEPMAENLTRTVSTFDPRNRQAIKPRAAHSFSKVAPMTTASLINGRSLEFDL